MYLRNYINQERRFLLKAKKKLQQDYSILYRAVFKCTSCGFMFSKLGGQATYEIEGYCPSCGEDVDYASKADIKNHVENLAFDLKYLLD